MLGDAVLNAASRATHNALENVTRRIAWAGAAVIFLVGAFTVALILSFWLLRPILGDVEAAGVIVGACLLIALFCASMPWMIERMERPPRKTTTSAVATTAAVVDQEAREAVDYFGAIRLVSAAFLFGLDTARRLRR
jgi:uncharacterized membrane protein YdcZ (DUF606 family)